MTGRHRETELARRSRARGLAAGRSTPQIADEIHELCGPRFGTTRIKSHRLAHGIALADVIEQVRALFERDGKPIPGIGETLLSAYESGLKRPGPEYLHYLCTVYRVEPVALGYDGPCICGHGHRMPGVVRGTEVEESKPEVVPSQRELWIQQTGSDAPGAGGEEDENVLRRTLLQLLAATGTGVALDPEIHSRVFGAVDNIRRRMDDTLVSATVSPAMLDQWEDATSGFGRQYMNTPPLQLLCDVLLEFSSVRKAMAHRQPVDLQERLCRMAARLAGLSGMIMINLGDHRLARSFFRTGRTAADETGDRALRAWVIARESLVPLYYGDPREALNLARKSRDLAGQTPCAAQAMAPIVEARALAMLAGAGKKDVVDQAKRALSRARAAFARMNSDVQGDIAFGYTERQLYFHQGDALVRLGQPLEADVILEQALAKYEPSEWLDPTLIKFDRARCKLLEGEVEEAVAMAMKTWQSLDDDYRADIVVRKAQDLVKAAEQVRNADQIPQLRELKEAIATRTKVTNA
ncbi:XRE family transcriptional regulator [Thermopolyspora sp. NPDC052614]|uniref:XRE family transcriptional regulator n=1 Tax=Thermopolyspora sp. NPDC052614 TaxID=3155682 RepID=UPI0034260E6C